MSSKKKGTVLISLEEKLASDDNEELLCGLCGLPISQGTMARAMGNVYHKHCFRCDLTECGSMLESRFYKKKGRAFCNRSCAIKAAANDEEQASLGASLAPPRAADRSRVRSPRSLNPSSPSSIESSKSISPSQRKNSASDLHNLDAAAAGPTHAADSPQHLSSSARHRIQKARASVSPSSSSPRLSSSGTVRGGGSRGTRYSGISTSFAPRAPAPPDPEQEAPLFPWEEEQRRRRRPENTAMSPLVSDPNYGFVPGASKPAGDNSADYGWLPGQPQPRETEVSASSAELGHHGDTGRAAKFRRVFQSLVGPQDHFVAQFNCLAYDYASHRVLNGRLYISESHLAFAGAPLDESRGGSSVSRLSSSSAAASSPSSPAAGGTSWTLVRLPLTHVVSVLPELKSLPMPPDYRPAENVPKLKNGLVAYTRSSQAHVFFNFIFFQSALRVIQCQLHRDAIARKEIIERLDASKRERLATVSAASPSAADALQQSIIPLADDQEGSDALPQSSGDDRSLPHSDDAPGAVASQERHQKAKKDLRRSKKLKKTLGSLFRRSKTSASLSAGASGNAEAVERWAPKSLAFAAHASVFDDFDLAAPLPQDGAIEQDDPLAWDEFTRFLKKSAVEF